jgi:hypothetical protein
LIVVVGVDLKDPIQYPYCGLKNMRRSTMYTLFRNLNGEDFDLVKPHDPSLVLIWMGKTQCDVVKDEESTFFKMVKVQWWVLMKKGAIWMDDIYMKIVGMESGNVIL